MSTILTATDITVRYGARAVLDSATLAIEEGDRIGLVGRNGCGQDNLSETARGRADARHRRCHSRRDLVVSYLPQDFMLDASKLVAENIRDGRKAGAGSDRGV
jgi:ATP-binding cassette subfamily F protein uup